ncbi:unnamed protein product [Rhizophagus irregularis]|nr:unnamed protein product [Rhizophagus irregularis]
MFEAINSSIFPGINYVSTIPRTCYFPKVDTYQEITDNIEESLSHKVLGYLDDTIWLAENLTDLVSNLKIADSFYQLANIHINKEKTIILANKYAKKIIKNNLVAPINHIDLEFSSTIIKVPILAQYKAARILGVHFNPNDCHNTILHSNIYPNIVNFFDHQLKVQSSLLVTQANNPYTSNTLKFLFLLCQQKHWLPNSIINFFDLFDKPLKCFSRLESLLTFFKFYNLSLSSNFKFSMKGGTYPLSHFIIDKKFLFAHINSIRNKGIMFLYHIITKDYAFLEDYNDIKKHLVHKGGKIPHWYNFLKENITINNQGRLVFDLNRPIIQNPSAPRSAIPSEDPNTLHHPKRS